MVKAVIQVVSDIGLRKVQEEGEKNRESDSYADCWWLALSPHTQQEGPGFDSPKPQIFRPMETLNYP